MTLLCKALRPTKPWKNKHVVQGKKSFYHHRGTPSLSVCRPTPRSQSEKAMVYTIALGKQGKRVVTIGLERRVYTIEAAESEKEKRRVSHGGGVYFFLPC